MCQEWTSPDGRLSACAYLNSAAARVQEGRGLEMSGPPPLCSDPTASMRPFLLPGRETFRPQSGIPLGSNSRRRTPRSLPAREAVAATFGPATTTLGRTRATPANGAGSCFRWFIAWRGVRNRKPTGCVRWPRGDTATGSKTVTGQISAELGVAGRAKPGATEDKINLAG